MRDDRNYQKVKAVSPALFPFARICRLWLGAAPLPYPLVPSINLRHPLHSSSGFALVHVGQVDEDAFEGVEAELEAPFGLDRLQGCHVVLATHFVESEVAPLGIELNVGPKTTLDHMTFPDFEGTNFPQKAHHQSHEILSGTRLFGDLIDRHASGPPVDHLNISNQGHVEGTVEE